MGHIRDNFEEYRTRKAGVVGIVAQDPAKVKEYLEGKKKGYPFPLLVDEDRSVVKKYGVHVKFNFESYNIARPSNFILDRVGVIRYVHVGYHQADFPGDRELYEVLDGIP